MTMQSARVWRIASLSVAMLANVSFASRTARAEEPLATKVEVQDDIVYGRIHGAGLLADIAYPVSKQPLPAIISVHGGRWVGGHKRDASSIKKDSKPLLVLHSDNDRSVPIDNALAMIDVLKKAEARHTFHRYPEMGHMGINDEVIEKSLAFMNQLSAEKPGE